MPCQLKEFGVWERLEVHLVWEPEGEGPQGAFLVHTTVDEGVLVERSPLFPCNLFVSFPVKGV